MARILIVEGGQRGLALAGELHADGHAVRVTTGAPALRGEIEAVGAECFLGTPERLATLRGALEHVTIACWLLAGDDAAGDSPESARALHGPRLERFLCDAIDSTLRGFLYESGGRTVPEGVLERGRRIVSETAALNSIPVAITTADPAELASWLARTRSAIDSLLEGRSTGVDGSRAAAV